MSCCCCCEALCRELLEGIRKKERLLPEEEPAGGGGGGGGGGEAESSRRNMDISLLREQYRSSREKQRKQTQVLLFRTVSEELSDAVSIVPVTQDLTPLLPTIIFDPDPTAYDPWHVHLDHHRRSHTVVAVQLPVSSPETNTSIDSSSRCSESCSLETGSSQQESRSRKLSMDSTRDSLSSCREQENHYDACRSREDPDSESSTGDCFSSSEVDPAQVSVTGSLSPSEQQSRGPPDGSFSSSNEDSVCSSNTLSQEGSVPGSWTSSDESSTPVASIASSPCSSNTNQHEDLKETRSADTKSSSGVLQTNSTPTQRGSRKFSPAANRFTRQLSVGGRARPQGSSITRTTTPSPTGRPHVSLRPPGGWECTRPFKRLESL
ncbi:putative protein TPRXL isoform X2 [Anabas testudineus]|uniref:putative protein TPRXL isoform X2 n=2 Tax=Anabas testudineus TaxID=64144 RepID=UPI000E45EEFE|nr:putative protein TPRXL isoform X2 [Anabas testudineus]